MSKILLAMRHGDYRWDTDTKELSDQGISDVEDQAENLIQHGIRPDIIIVSPELRATETAEKLKEKFNKSAKHEILIVERKELLPYGDVVTIKDILKDEAVNEDSKTIMIVAHETNINYIGFCINSIEPDLEKSQAIKYEFNSDKWSNISYKNIKEGSVEIFKDNTKIPQPPRTYGN